MNDAMIWTPEEVAAGCHMVAAGFLYGPVHLDPNEQRAWHGRLAQKAPVLRDMWRSLIASLDGNAAEERAIQDFHQCLEMPVPGRYVPPYASCYLDTPAVLWGPSTRKVLGWYDQGGLEWHPFRHIVAPDHAGVEWAFLAELSTWRLPEVPYIRPLVAAHIQSWFPLFLSRLEKSAYSPYYPALGRWGLAWITATRMMETEAGRKIMP